VRLDSRLEADELISEYFAAKKGLNGFGNGIRCSMLFTANRSRCLDKLWGSHNHSEEAY